MPVMMAAVVRLLKSKSLMQHTDLFNELLTDITIFRCDKRMCVAELPTI